ncbi:hypothetical protein G0Q06_03225 [Puniceicoccales bacterium CK1056]|uniref:Uncharacterized protein n=1 Tax=Oceanipulchritudo coccoides TaxID=2706888 RepID=A0A6B2M0Z1_9BACT|nr:hypothetical protein [Oceanipulchritudo coccoides]NDV61455.1 hypothetical protein [Oceanipulchritudo coccoides]
MKPPSTLQASLLAVVLLTAGCEYEVALSDPMGLPIDESVLGTWTKLNEHGEVGRNPDQISIYAFDEGEYLVVAHGRDPIYFRAYPILINDIPCVQMKVLADYDETRHSETEAEENGKLYMVVQYTIEEGKLVVSSFDPEIISPDITSTEKLMEAVHAHSDDPDLFGERDTYIR